MIELLGIVAITIMVGSYALENVHSAFIATFAMGCVLATVYAGMIGSYPFVVAEGLWALIAARKWWHSTNYSD